MCNVQVKYDPCDGDPRDDVQCHVMHLANMVDHGGVAAKYAWGLVEQGGLSNYEGREVRNPLCAKRRGAKEHKRKAPAHGPGSRKGKKHAASPGAASSTTSSPARPSRRKPRG